MGAVSDLRQTGIIFSYQTRRGDPCGRPSAPGPPAFLSLRDTGDRKGRPYTGKPKFQFTQFRHAEDGTHDRCRPRFINKRYFFLCVYSDRFGMTARILYRILSFSTAQGIPFDKKDGIMLLCEVWGCVLWVTKSAGSLTG